MRTSLLKGWDKMRNLLIFNFRKLRRQKSFYICVGIMLVMILITASMYKALEAMLSDTGLNQNASSTTQLLNAMMTGTGFALSGLTNSSFIMIFGIITALAVCDDFEQHTVKTIFGRGYSRVKYYFSKLVATLTSATAAFVLITACSFGLGAAFFGLNNVQFGKIASLIGVQYIAALAAASLVFMLSFLLKKTGLSIAAVIIIPSVLDLIMTLLDYMLNLKDMHITDFWLTTIFTDLANISIQPGRILSCLFIALGYIAVFVSLGAIFARKTEA